MNKKIFNVAFDFNQSYFFLFRDNLTFLNIHI